MIDNTSSCLPLVTIGITCYNAEDTIGRAIESALNQDWPHLEIIVIDDGSSDRSPEIIRNLTENDPRARYICHDVNRGYAGALNTIVEEAAGEYIAFFDDDDVSVPERISRQWRRLTSYSETQDTGLVFCYSNRVVIEPEAEQTTTVLAIGRHPVEPSGNAVADFLLWLGERAGFVWGSFGSCTLFTSKRTMNEVGSLDENFRRSAEWDLAIRLAVMGGHFIAVDEPLITQHKETTSDKSGNIPLIYSLKLREKHEAYLKSKHVYLASVAMAHSRFQYSNGKRLTSRLYVALACLCSPLTVLPSELAKWKQRKRRSA